MIPDDLPFTRIQRRMLEVLEDGEAHKRDELVACLHDDLAPYTNIHAHLCGIRKLIRPYGQTILCVSKYRRLYYQRVILYKPSLRNHTSGGRESNQNATSLSASSRKR